MKFINEQMTVSDSIAIMSFASAVKLEQEFTDDKETLLSVIKKFRLGEGLMPSITEDAPEGEDAPVVDEAELDLFNTDRRLSGLEQAAKMLAPFPEKKALIYFSSGSSGSGSENAAQLQATINAAVRSNVSYYPIDVRGLQAIPPGAAASESGPKGTAIFSGQAQRGQRDKQNTEQDTLYALATDTGGKALLDNNDLTVGMQQAQKDLQSYYVLGFYSTNADSRRPVPKVEVKLIGRSEREARFSIGLLRGEGMEGAEFDRSRAAVAGSVDCSATHERNRAGAGGRLVPTERFEVFHSCRATNSGFGSDAEQEELGGLRLYRSGEGYER